MTTAEGDGSVGPTVLRTSFTVKFLVTEVVGGDEGSDGKGLAVVVVELIDCVDAKSTSSSTSARPLGDRAAALPEAAEE